MRLGTDVGDIDAANWYVRSSSIAIRWAQGRMGELLGLVDELDQSGTVPELGGVSTAALAVVAASAGDEVTARSALARLGAGRLRRLPRGSVWLVTMAAVCDAANMLADAEAASEVYELLAPFATLPVLVGLGVACFGSVHRSLGVAALTFGRRRSRDRPPGVGRGGQSGIGQPAGLRRVAGDGSEPAQRIATTRAIRRRHSGCKQPRIGMLRNAECPPTLASGFVYRGRSNVGVVRICQSATACRISVGGRVVVVRPTVGIRYLAELTDNPGRSISTGRVGEQPWRRGHDTSKRTGPRRRGQGSLPVRESASSAPRSTMPTTVPTSSTPVERLEMDEVVEHLSRVCGLRSDALVRRRS